MCLFVARARRRLPGGFAQYVAVRADLAHPFGKTLPFEAAAMVEPFACVVHGAQRARVHFYLATDRTFLNSLDTTRP